MPDTILFIDDEPKWARPYVDELGEAGFEDVIIQSDISAAMDFFDQNPLQIAVISLDIMMPPSSRFRDSETEGGVRTGIRAFEYIRESAPRLPIVILTHVTDQAVEKKFVAEPFTTFVRKKDCFPHELAGIVRDLISVGAGTGAVN